MAITEADIKLLASQRMTDTDDGGGRMTGSVVQSGVDNNIFDDVSNLDRVYGRVSLRKVFAAVLTTDTDKYLGARIMLDQAPADSNVHGLLFDASSTFDTRSDTTSKVEAYLAPGAAYQGLLYGNHLAGQSTVMLLQRPERPLPSVGDVFMLRSAEGLVNEFDQYVRVTAVASADQTFSDGSDFVRTIVTLSISDPLREAFPGFDAVKNDASINYTGKTRVYATLVADAAQYYGIRPLDGAVSTGAYTLKVDTVYSYLLPSAQIETPLADARTNGVSAAFVPAGGPVQLNVTALFTTTQNLFVGAAILPGSLIVTRSDVSLFDSGGVLTQGGEAVGTVDYTNGILTLSTNVWGGSSGTHQIGYTPAGTPEAVTQSLGIPITINNRSLSYVLTIESTLARRSLSVSFLASGRWYTLTEDGTGAVTGSDSSLGAGTYNYTTGTLAVTLGSLPDVGSALILQWVEADTAPPAADTTLRNGRLFVPLNTNGNASSDPGAKSIVPGALTVTWSNGGTKTATDDGLGNITGDATGTVDYSHGRLWLSPATLPADDAVYSISTDSATQTTGTIVLSTSGANLVGTLGSGAINEGSVRLTLVLSAAFAPEGTGANAKAYTPAATTATVIAYDAGGVLYVDGTTGAVSVGTINYTTGAVSIPAAVPLPHTTPTTVPVFIQRWVPEFAGTNMTVTAHWAVGSQVALGAAPASFSFTCTTGSKAVTYASGAPSAQSISVAVGSYYLQAGIPAGFSLRNVGFTLGADTYRATTAGVLQRNPDPATGAGTAVGSVTSATGLVQLDTWTTGVNSLVTDWSGTQTPATDGLSSPFMASNVTFRTAAVPIRPASLSVLGTMEDGTTFNVTAGSNGQINGTRVKGRVDVETGLVELWFVNPAAASGPTIDLTSLGISGVGVMYADLARTPSLRYNAVAYTYLPLDADILGLDPVRLPQDGRVPIFKAGRVVVIHNTQSMAPATVVNGQTLNTARTRLARIRVFGNDGDQITTGFSTDLDAGTVTFSAVAGYSQPVTVEHRIEDEALCAEAQITGDLRLTRPLTHDFADPGTFVSSALIAGDLQGAAGESFSQQTWTSVWSDSPIGNAIAAQYNQALNPIVVTNQGAIQERWALIFTSGTAFRVVGEEVGEILQSNTGEVCAPVNPATGVAYFSIASAGWGSGWAAGNVLRFNTSAANFPVWVARTVLQSPAAAPGTDQMVLSIRGDINV